MIGIFWSIAVRLSLFVGFHPLAGPSGRMLINAFCSIIEDFIHSHIVIDFPSAMANWIPILTQASLMILVWSDLCKALVTSRNDCICTHQGAQRYRKYIRIENQ